MNRTQPPRSFSTGPYAPAWQERIRTIERRIFGYACDDHPPALDGPYYQPYDQPLYGERSLLHDIYSTENRGRSPPRVYSASPQPPFEECRQFVTDALGHVTSLPAPSDFLLPAGGGKGLSESSHAPKPADPKAPKHSPARWLSGPDMGRIKSMTTPPTVRATLDNLAFTAQPSGHFYELFRVKRVIDLIEKLGDAKTLAQKEWVESYTLPEWWYEAIRDHPRINIPSSTAPMEEWRKVYSETTPETLSIRGVSRLDDGTPNIEQLQGRNLFLQIAPAKPKNKAVERRTRNTVYHLVLPTFADESRYMAKVSELGLTIANEWKPERFPHAENVELNDFIGHAAKCGLSHDNLALIRKFAMEWIANPREVVMKDAST
jgi:hypothetical protein